MSTRAQRSRKRFLTDAAAVGAGVVAGAELLGSGRSVEAAHSGADAVTISFIDHQKLRTSVWPRWIPKFEAAMAAKGTPIKVQLQIGPTPDVDFTTKLTVNYGANNPTDVVASGAGALAPFVSAGYLRDLTPYVNKWPEWQKQYYPVVRKEVSVGGKVYGIPGDAALEMLFYRKDIMRKHGISTAQPQSWADLLDRAREIKRKTGKYALLYDAGIQWGGGVWEESFVNLMLGTHSKIYDESKKKWIVRSKGLLQCMEFYETLTKEALLPVQPLLSPSPWVIPKYKMFPAGDLIVSCGGSWSWEFDWGPHGAGPIPHYLSALGTWNFPTVDGKGKPFVWAGVGGVYTISQASQHPNEAFEFIKFISQPGPLADMLTSVGAISPRTDTRANAAYSAMRHIVSTESQLSTGQFFLSHDGQDKFETYIAQATEAIITRRLTAKQAMDQFAADCKKGLGAANVTEE